MPTRAFIGEWTIQQWRDEDESAKAGREGYPKLSRILISGAVMSVTLRVVVVPGTVWCSSDISRIILITVIISCWSAAITSIIYRKHEKLNSSLNYNEWGKRNHLFAVWLLFHSHFINCISLLVSLQSKYFFFFIDWIRAEWCIMGDEIIIFSMSFFYFIPAYLFITIIRCEYHQVKIQKNVKECVKVIVESWIELSVDWSGQLR